MLLIIVAATLLTGLAWTILDLADDHRRRPAPNPPTALPEPHRPDRDALAA